MAGSTGPQNKNDIPQITDTQNLSWLDQPYLLYENDMYIDPVYNCSFYIIIPDYNSIDYFSGSVCNSKITL